MIKTIDQLADEVRHLTAQIPREPSNRAGLHMREPEYRLSRSQALKKLWKDEGYRNRMIQGMRQRYATEKGRKHLNSIRPLSHQARRANNV